jgi:hypothetical protein
MLSWNRATENSVLFVRIPTTSIMVIMYYASHLTLALFTDKYHFISMYRSSISRVSLSIISYLHCMLRVNSKAHLSLEKPPPNLKLKSLLSGLPLVGAWMHDIRTNDTRCERPKWAQTNASVDMNSFKIRIAKWSPMSFWRHELTFPKHTRSVHDPTTRGLQRASIFQYHYTANVQDEITKQRTYSYAVTASRPHMFNADCCPQPHFPIIAGSAGNSLSIWSVWQTSDIVPHSPLCTFLPAHVWPSAYIEHSDEPKTDSSPD